MNHPLVVRGHTDPTHGAAHDAAGQRIVERRGGLGCAKCSCGALSSPLPSQPARNRWHRIHREQLAGVAWAS